MLFVNIMHEQSNADPSLFNDENYFLKVNLSKKQLISLHIYDQGRIEGGVRGT